MTCWSAFEIMVLMRRDYIEIDELSALWQCAIKKHLLCSAVCSDDLGMLYILAIRMKNVGVPP